MASTGDHLFTKRVTFEDSSTFLVSGTKTLETDGLDLYFNGTKLQGGNVFNIITTNTITSTNGSNVTIDSNLFLSATPAPEIIANPEGLQTDGFNLYFN